MRVSIATLGLILLQAALGGLTVEEGLKQELVATHLGVAMLQIGLVLLMGRLGGPDPPPTLRPGATRAIRALTGVALVAVLGTIAVVTSLFMIFAKLNLLGSLLFGTAIGIYIPHYLVGRMGRKRDRKSVVRERV